MAHGRMTRWVNPQVTVAVEIDAPASATWDELAAIERHVEWMHDAEEIRFTSDSTAGLGTTFDCETRIGPFRTTDRMEIVGWIDGASIAVRHVGLVTGTGEFSLVPIDLGRRSRLTWSEQLRFPWYFGGPVGVVVAARLVFTPLWRANLRRLRDRVEAHQPPPT